MFLCCIVKLQCVVRRKRAADNGDAGESKENNMLDGVYILPVLITSQDQPEPAPDSPIHETSVFPTPTGLNATMAEHLCLAAIQTSVSYQKCRSYATVDTLHYVQSCVDDIRVTAVICIHRQICVTTVILFQSLLLFTESSRRLSLS